MVDSISGEGARKVAVKRKFHFSNTKSPSNEISSTTSKSIIKVKPETVRADFELELLDCPICSAPFTVPIFQCENGHTACSSCCQRLAKKCPSCSLPIGSIRCRALEAVLDSVKLHCRNYVRGCAQLLSYGETYLEHETTCELAPCQCPMPGCKCECSSDDLINHIKGLHKGVMINFVYDQSFSVSFTNDDKFLVLGVKLGLFLGGVVFLLNNNRVEQFGNVITISCIAPLSSKQSYCYDLAVKGEGTTRHTFRSFTKNIPRKYEGPGTPSFGFLIDPVSAVGDNGKISLDICIWNHSSHPSAIPITTML